MFFVRRSAEGGRGGNQFGVTRRPERERLPGPVTTRFFFSHGHDGEGSCLPHGVDVLVLATIFHIGPPHQLLVGRVDVNDGLSTSQVSRNG